MQTATSPFDYDALVMPIEKAATTSEARSAVWGALRECRNRISPAAWRGTGLCNVMAAIDAAAWTAGLSEKFRRNAIITTTMTMNADDICSDCWHTTESESVKCYRQKAAERYPVIPDKVRDLV